MIPKYKGRLVLLGPPGVGKTRYLADRAPKIVALSARGLTEDSSPILIASLTRAAAKEIGSRVHGLSSRATATLHAHCLRSMDGSVLIVDRDLVLDDWNRRRPALAITPPKRRNRIPDDIIGSRPGDMPGDEVAAEYDRLRLMLVAPERMPQRVQVFARLWEPWKRDHGAIDFVDMLAFAADVPPLDPDVIIVDEAQDLPPLGWQVVLRWGEHAGGLIAVGDPWQALYDPWAGADAATFLRLWREADDHGVLKRSWRVPAAVHRLAMKWIRQLSDYEPIEYYPRRVDCNNLASPFVEGSVVRCDATWADPEAAVQEAEELAAQGRRVLFIFTANYMTGPICALLRKRLLSFGNPWRPDEPLWNPLVDPAATALLPLLDPAKRWTAPNLRDWTKPLRSHGILRRGAKKEIEARASGNRHLAADEIASWFEPAAYAELQARIAAGDRNTLLSWWQERLLSRHAESAGYGVAVTLARGPDALGQEPLLHPSTAHASKGGEADHVFLFPDLSAAADDAWFSGGRERDPIIRAFYVAITRTREVLHICEPAGRRFVDL